MTEKKDNWMGEMVTEHPDKLAFIGLRFDSDYLREGLSKGYFGVFNGHSLVCGPH